MLDTYVVNDHGHGLHIYPASKNIRRNQHLSLAGSELINDPVAIRAFQSTAELRNLVSLCYHATFELFCSSACSYEDNR